MTAYIADIHISNRKTPQPEDIHVVDTLNNWVPMEINAGEPQLVYEHNDKTIAKIHAAMLARQLKRIAQAGTTGYNGGIHNA